MAITTGKVRASYVSIFQPKVPQQDRFVISRFYQFCKRRVSVGYLSVALALYDLPSFQPKVPQNGGDPKYSVTLLIPKTDTATINGIYAEMEKAKQQD